MIPMLLSIGLATLLSEDAACITAGVLVANGVVDPYSGTLACFAGIFVGDLLLFLAGRLIGRNAAARWIGEDKLNQAAAWIAKRGLAVVLISRFTPGLRLPTYVSAGVLRSSIWTFSAYFLIACALWTPLLVGGTALIGEQALRSALGHYSPLAALASVAALAFAATKLRRFETRRRLVGFLKRKIRWEFWPAWAAYLPLIPYFVYLAARYRSLALFTASNPGIPSGGLMGESKSAILEHLSQVESAVPEFTLLSSGCSLNAARAFMNKRGVNFPVVLKPDQGERGSGVSIVRDENELSEALLKASADMILQRYVDGREFGVYYVRYPASAEGTVLSVTRKSFPSVTGDGIASLRQLILRDSRAVCLADAYQRAARRPLDRVIPEGETVPLVEIGSHCRGSVFEDGSHLITPALSQRVDHLSQSHPGFYLGRYDVRAQSEEALSQGEFQVIELNGVAAEATHIYDPSIGLLEAYRTMARHWRMAFEIGALNRAQGFDPMRVSEVLRLVFSRRPSGVARAKQGTNYRQLRAVHHQ